VGTPEIKDKLAILTVLPFLKHTHSEAVREFGHVFDDKARYPITYNHYFSDNIQKIQQEC
jgi:hypothetical protein